MKKALPSDITSYDLLKTFAVVIMIIDHIGAYFFPDQLWWRAVGRVGFPIWFFLVGHASGRNLPFKLLGGAGILIAANFIAGMSIFPLNALITIIILRLIIDPVMSFANKSKTHFWLGTAVLIAWVPVTYNFTEYGTLALMTAMFGYMVRHKNKYDHKHIFDFMVTVLVTFLLIQQIVYGMSIVQFLVMGVGTALIRLLLLDFKAQTFPKLTPKMPSLITWVALFCGRKTLEIYVVHLLIFKFTALYLGLDDFGFMDFDWYRD